MKNTLLPALLLSVLAPACALRGERATTGCPTGVVCSPATPMGLGFYGASVAGPISIASQPLTTAVGGTQTIEARLPDGTRFTRAFNATTDSTAMTIVGNASPPVARVRGVSPGTSRLSLVDPTTNALFDRVSLSVAALGRIGFVAEDALHGEPWFSDHINVFAGSTVHLGVDLRSAAGSALADEGIIVSVAPSNVATLTRTDWNSVTLSAGATADTGTLRVTQAGMAHPFQLRVVDSVDDVVLATGVDGATDPSAPIDIRDGASFCFLGTTGSETVFGAPLAFAISTGATLRDTTGDIFSNCAVVAATAPGTATLTVTSGAVRRTFRLTFVAP